MILGRNSIRIGLSISQSGRYEVPGRMALHAIMLWSETVNASGGIAPSSREKPLPVRLTFLDDKSSAEQAVRNTSVLLDKQKVDVLFGPYSSALMRAVTRVAAERGKMVWNHGGASFTMPEGARVVDLPSPAETYLRALPERLRQDSLEEGVIAVLQGQGAFPSQVAAGLEEASAERFKVVRILFSSPLNKVDDLVTAALETRPVALVSAGSFEDDILIVRHLKRLARVHHIVAIAAGINRFGDELGPLSEGVTGPSQWEPEVGRDPEAGPDSGWFTRNFRKQFRKEPDYIAAQAFALGVVFERCFKMSGGALQDSELWYAARNLDIRTLYGRFRLDPVKSRQIGHSILLVQWQSGRKQIVWTGD
jgi:branched-chain amino acid transport system substrate-binding protein